jgi:hypothetical protein
MEDFGSDGSNDSDSELEADERRNQGSSRNEPVVVLTDSKVLPLNNQREQAPQVGSALKRNADGSTITPVMLPRQKKTLKPKVCF